MPSTVFAGSKVKALKDRFSLNDVTEIISVNADPSSGGGVAAPLGSIAMDYLAGKVYKKTGSLATEWQELGAGLGGINYIENPDAESGIAGWNLYADAAGVQPVDGTGGTANITWSRSTTSPLRGVADFNLVKDAANRQGQGVSYDFTIDAADQAKILTVTFDYEILSGTYATGDLAVYVIQDPAGTPVVIQPAGFQVEAATVGNKVREVATFQTASNVTSYRLCIHVASTSALAYSLALDNVSVSPQQVVYGAPVTDWQSYTPTFTGFGTVTNSDFYWRRVGDSIQVQGRVTSGTSTATEARISLPFTTSSTKLPASTSEVGAHVGTGIGTVYNVMLADRSQAYLKFGTQGASSAGLTAQNGSALYGSGQSFSLFAEVPIEGFSSSVVVSSSADTRVVAARIFKTTNQGPFAVETKLTGYTVDRDSHGMWDPTNNRFNIQVPGDYQLFIQTNGIPAPTATQVPAYRINGGTSNYIGCDTANTGASRTGGSGVIPNLKAGDFVEIYHFTSANTTVQAGTASSYVSLVRISGPSQIAASETVAASYYLNANQAVTANVTPINFNTKIFDTHGAVTTGASWRFTAPVAGKYDFVTIQYAGASSFELMLYKNGSVLMGGTGAISGIVGTAVNTLDLLANDYIEFRSNASVTIQGGLLTGSTTGKVHIKRVGN